MERIIKTRSLADLVAEHQPRDERANPQGRILPALHAIYKPCLDCTLPDCDEESRACLVTVLARRDPALKKTVTYVRFEEKNLERRAGQKRAAYDRRRAREAAQRREGL